MGVVMKRTEFRIRNRGIVKLLLQVESILGTAKHLCRLEPLIAREWTGDEFMGHFCRVLTLIGTRQ